MLNGKKLIGVTLRVDEHPERDEWRDALDRAWLAFLGQCQCVALPLPNAVEHGVALFESLPVDGLLLTGGNDLEVVGGDCPERDALEWRLLSSARRRGLPVIGVCRGMQLIQDVFDVRIHAVEGHVARSQDITIYERRTSVNSYHAYGARDTAPELDIWARSDDGVVKAIRHVREPIVGMMWHPERETPFCEGDIALFSVHYGSVQ